MTTAIIRHRRENLKKCSLSGLEKRFRFFTYPIDPLPDLSSYLLLKLDAPPLTAQDASRNILLIDATWRLAQTIEKNLPYKLEARSLPSFQTAYPRRQTHCPDPKMGLSSIEALYIAHLILKRPCADLLDHYYWKEEFLALNFGADAEQPMR